MTEFLKPSTEPQQASLPLKRQPDQYESHQLRTRRVETRVTTDEHTKICARASSEGFSSVAQYVRQRALYGSDNSPSCQQKALIACQGELNDITGHVNQIARHLTQGKSLDDEMLLVMLQVLDLAEENLKRISHCSSEAA